MNHLFAAEALLDTGWAHDVLMEIDGAGTIAAITPDAKAGNAARASGPVIPGMANVHSHAFQRAMAGLAEGAGPGADSFWRWRQVMYDFAARLTPDELGAITAQLCVELLKQGYTSLGEFHYLHNAPDGAPYNDRAEMSVRVIEAARGAGIAITHLPVLYAHGGFGGAPLEDRQRRFAADDVLAIIADVRRRYAGDADVRVGLAPHSLRAVTPALLAEAVAELHDADADAPVHIHVAEQTREVEDCLAWSGARPVQWLLDNAGVDGRWCLVHATHMDRQETRRLAAAQAVAGLCPTTEANLGDGLFALADYLGAGGRFGIGSDSNVSVSPVEELRWLEYGQRVHHQRRGVAASGAALWQEAAAGGAQALARPAGVIAPGRRADLVMLDGGHVTLAGRHGDRLLDALIFAGNDCLVRDVMVGGRFVIEDGCHAREDEIAQAYRRAVSVTRAIAVGPRLA